MRGKGNSGRKGSAQAMYTDKGNFTQSDTVCQLNDFMNNQTH